MKKKSLLFLLIFSVFTLLSQKNASKLNLLPGTFFKVFSICQERAITDRMSIQASFRYLPSHSVSGFGLNKVHYNGNEYNPFTDAKLSGFGNFTELRIYGDEKKALHGFYWGPYINIMTYKLSTTKFYAEFHDNDNNVYSADIQQYFKLTAIGLGLQIGVQKIFDNKMVLDWTILGLGFNSLGFKGGIEATNTSANFDFRNYTNDVDKVTLGLEKYLPLGKVIDEKKVEIGVRVPSVQLKMGVAIGFGY
ncbi:MAG: DUF3575 domain-containing protein [Bacteroidia bacterium]